MVSASSAFFASGTLYPFMVKNSWVGWSTANSSSASKRVSLPVAGASAVREDSSRSRGLDKIVGSRVDGGSNRYLVDVIT